MRSVMVVAEMKMMGNWNGYLPNRVRRALRLRPSRPAAETGWGG